MFVPRRFRIETFDIKSESECCGTSNYGAQRWERNSIFLPFLHTNRNSNQNLLVYSFGLLSQSWFISCEKRHQNLERNWMRNATNDIGKLRKWAPHKLFRCIDDENAIFRDVARNFKTIIASSLSWTASSSSSPAATVIMSRCFSSVIQKIFNPRPRRLISPFLYPISTIIALTLSLSS